MTSLLNEPILTWTFIPTYEYVVGCSSIIIPLLSCCTRLLNAWESPHAMLILFNNYLLFSCEICCDLAKTNYYWSRRYPMSIMIFAVHINVQHISQLTSIIT